MNTTTAPNDSEAGRQLRPVDTPHVVFLDGLRGLAALYVMLHHAWMLSVEHWSGLAASFFRTVLERGHVAVDVFIVLSGFCLMLPVTRGDGTIPKGSRLFFWRRAWRILPSYFIALAASALLATTLLKYPANNLWDTCIPVTFQGLIYHFLLVHELSTRTYLQINAVFWSVAVEWKIYFLFPVLVFFCRRIGPLAVAGITVALSYVLLIGLRYTSVNTQTAGVSAHYLGLFALGILAESIGFGRTKMLVRIRTSTPWLLAFLAATVLALAAAKIKLRHEDLTPFNDFFVGLWAATLLVCLTVRQHGIMFRFVAFAPIAFIGTFAYSLYLIHLPVLQILWQYGLQRLNMPPWAALGAMLLMAAPLTVAISYGFFLAFERPFLNQRKISAAGSARHPVGASSPSPAFENQRPAVEGSAVA